MGYLARGLIDLFLENISYMVPLEATFVGNMSDRILNHLQVDVYIVPGNLHEFTNEIQ